MESGFAVPTLRTTARRVGQPHNWSCKGGPAPRTDCVSRTRDCKDQRGVAEGRGTKRRCSCCYRRIIWLRRSAHFPVPASTSNKYPGPVVEKSP
jgi:hypothetical protein